MLSFTAPARHGVTFDDTYLTCATTPNPPPSCPRQSHHGGCQRSNINNMLTDYFTKKKKLCKESFCSTFYAWRNKIYYILLSISLCLSLSALNDSGLFTEWHSAGGARAKEIEQQRREIECIIQVTKSKTFYYYYFFNLLSVCCGTRSHFS